MVEADCGGGGDQRIGGAVTLVANVGMVAFQSLKADIRDGNAQLNEEIRASNAQLREEIKGSETQLREEIRASEARQREDLREVKARTQGRQPDTGGTLGSGG